MNKHLPVLIVLLGFGLVGCATYTSENVRYLSAMEICYALSYENVQGKELNIVMSEYERRDIGSCEQYDYLNKKRHDEELRKTEAIAAALSNLGQQMQENSNAWRSEASQGSTSKIKKYLQSQSILSDGRRRCIYGVGATQEIRVLPTGKVCPMSI